MRNTIREFRENISKYCDDNIGERVLFTAFTHLCPLPKKSDKKSIVDSLSPKNLSSLTSRIVNDLIDEGILKEVNKPDDLRTGYGRYEILPHEKLIC